MTSKKQDNNLFIIKKNDRKDSAYMEFTSNNENAENINDVLKDVENLTEKVKKGVLSTRIDNNIDTSINFKKK